MGSSLRIPVEDPSQIGEARRAAQTLACGIGLDETRAGKVAIAVTEACTNLLKHAGGGEVLLRSTVVYDTQQPPAAISEIELLAVDRGPGMRDVEQCLQNGFSTGASPGQGLGAIRRLSAEADFYSVPGKGTVILARWFSVPLMLVEAARRSAGLQVGAVSVCKYGQEVCGDSWGVEHTAAESTILVADGLGHGYEASLASLEAVRMLSSHPGISPQALMEFAHSALRSSRGAAVAVARIDRARPEVTFCGVGNVMARIYAGSQPGQHLVSVNGTAGHQTQRVREFSYPWPGDGMLIIHSDGLTTGTGLEAQPRLAAHDPSVIAAVLYRDFARGHDDATIVVAKAA